jgi:hypothetical protein
VIVDNGDVMLGHRNLQGPGPNEHRQKSIKNP